MLRIKLRYEDIEAMVQRFAGNVGKQGLFLPTKSLQPIGAEVKFELRIANDTAVLVGLGRVKAARAPDPDNPRAAFGMALELMRVSREGRDVIMKMLERRRALGLPDVAIPMPDDVDAARRAELETLPNRAESGVVRELVPMLASEPASAPVLGAPRPASGPIAISKERSSAAIVAPLAPERSRPRRPNIDELIARASEASGVQLAATPELDEQVDVEAALVRARVLAGGDLDRELDALRDQVATPIELSIEGASAELARQLGGAAVVKRERAQWAPPPPVEVRDHEAEARARAEAAERERAAREQEEREARERDEREARQRADAAARAREAAEAQARDRERRRRELVRDDEPERVAKTATYGEPPGRMMIDDHADVAELEAALASTVAAPIEPLDLDEPQPGDSIVPLDVQRLDEDDLLDEGEHTQIGEAPRYPVQEYATQPSVPEELEGQLDAHLAAAEAEADADFVPEANADDFGGEEISDLEIIAEADEEDADLLAADGEADASNRVAQRDPDIPAHDLDFASRLALDDEDEQDAAQAGEHDRADSEFPDPPSSSYTFSEELPQVEHSGYREPSVLGVPPPAAADDDLESALADLDGDFDDLEVRPQPQPTAQPQQRNPRLPRASTDDGVLIDFDDDE